jgi:hypothetical protein
MRNLTIPTQVRVAHSEDAPQPTRRSAARRRAIKSHLHQKGPSQESLVFRAQTGAEYSSNLISITICNNKRNTPVSMATSIADAAPSMVFDKPTSETSHSQILMHVMNTKIISYHLAG